MKVVVWGGENLQGFDGLVGELCKLVERLGLKVDRRGF